MLSKKPSPDSVLTELDLALTFTLGNCTLLLSVAMANANAVIDGNQDATNHDTDGIGEDIVDIATPVDQPVL